MPIYKKKSGDCQFCVSVPLLDPENGVTNRSPPLILTPKVPKINKIGQKKSENRYFKHFSLYQGDLVTCMGDQEIQSASKRLPDNLGDWNAGC